MIMLQLIMDGVGNLACLNPILAGYAYQTEHITSHPQYRRFLIIDLFVQPEGICCVLMIVQPVLVRRASVRDASLLQASEPGFSIRQGASFDSGYSTAK
jgi:hypothetical protein